MGEAKNIYFTCLKMGLPKFLFLLELFSFPVLVFLILCAYPGLPPPLSDQELPAPKAAVPLQGPLKLNQKLDQAQKLFKGQLAGPESFAVRDGRIYTGIIGGDVVSFDAFDPSAGVISETRVAPPCPPHRHVYEENLCGRILGLEFDSAGHLILADSYYGLFEWNLDPETPPKPLVPASRLIDGRPNLITNSLTVSRKPEGFVYFTASSTLFSLNSSMIEVLSVRPSGRVLKYDPRDGNVETLVDHVPFANGIQLAVDESFLVYASVGFERVFKLHLTGDRKGEVEPFFDPPGIPDNIQPAPDGGFFIGVVAVEEEVETQYVSLPSPLRLLRENAWIRQAMANWMVNVINFLDLVERVFSSTIFKTLKFYVGNTETGTLLAPPRALVIHVDATGNVVETFHGSDGSVSKVCEGFVHGDWMYLGSPYGTMDGVARIPWRK